MLLQASDQINWFLHVLILSFPTIKNFPSGRTSIYSNHYQKKRDSVIIAAIFRNGDKPKIEEIEEVKKSCTAIKRLFSVYVQLNINNSNKSQFLLMLSKRMPVNWIESNLNRNQHVLKGWRREWTSIRKWKSEREREWVRRWNERKATVKVVCQSHSLETWVV